MSQLSSFIREAHKGEILSINSINLKVSEIQELKRFIKKGVITPNKEYLSKSFTEKELPMFLSGEKIHVYGEYIKN